MKKVCSLQKLATNIDCLASYFLMSKKLIDVLTPNFEYDVHTFVGACHPFHLLRITNFPSNQVREHSCLANKYGGIIYMSYVTIRNLWLKKKKIL